MTWEQKLMTTDGRGRVRVPEERREALLDEFERSGLSGVKFAKMSGYLTSHTRQGYQSHHLNQDAAYGPAIPYDYGVAVEFAGSTQQIGSGHWRFHKSMNVFWGIYRGRGTRPTNAAYLAALELSLLASGVDFDDSLGLVAIAAQQQILYGLLPLKPVPRLPM